MVPLLVVITILIFLSIELIRRYVLSKRPVSETKSQRPPVNIIEELLEEKSEPESVFFHPTHSWAYVDNDGSIQIGLDRFLKRVMGKIDRIEVPALGEKVFKKGSRIKIFSGNRDIQLTIPVEGDVYSINEDVLNDPEVLSKQSFWNSWIIKIKPVNFINNLSSYKFGKEAGLWLENEVTKLKNLLNEQGLAESLQLNTMQDGGVLIHGVTSLLSDEVWEKVKNEFFDIEE